MQYDLVVIGAGWAGFNAALKAAKLGKKVCLIEEKELGGTCLNKGCIPTKVFVKNSQHGISLNEIQLKKSDIVKRLGAGMSYLLKSAKIDYIEGRARIKANDCVSVGAGLSRPNEIRAKFILIATGSVPKDLPNLKIDHDKVISSDDVLNLNEAPKKILIIGAGAIGCEFACIFKNLGSEVTVVEIAQQILPGIDAQVSKKLQQALIKAGINIHTGKSFAELNFSDYDKVLLSVGRKSVTDGLFEKDLAIELKDGAFAAGRDLRTKVKNIFAAGDCIGGYMLAHVASYEGELAVENMFAAAQNRDYLVVPSSVFTYPEVASIGVSEEEAKQFGVSYKANTVHFLSVGMAHVLGDTQGFLKVIVENKTGRILGASIIGANASELVNIFSVAMKNNVTIDKLREVIFAHPSISEIVAEAAKSF